MNDGPHETLVQHSAPAEPGKVVLWGVPGREADARVTWQQLGHARMELGARDVITDDRNGALTFRVGPGRPHRKIMVKLRSDDTYALELGRLARYQGLPEWHSEATVGVDQGIYAEDLAQAVIDMYIQVVNA